MHMEETNSVLNKQSLNTENSQGQQGSVFPPVAAPSETQSVAPPVQVMNPEQAPTVIVPAKDGHSKVFYFLFGVVVLCFIAVTAFLIWGLQARKMLGGNTIGTSAITSVPSVLPKPTAAGVDDVVVKAQNLTADDTFGNIVLDIDNTDTASFDEDVSQFDQLFQFKK